MKDQVFYAYNRIITKVDNAINLETPTLTPKEMVELINKTYEYLQVLCAHYQNKAT